MSDCCNIHYHWPQYYGSPHICPCCGRCLYCGGQPSWPQPYQITWTVSTPAKTSESSG